MEDGILFFNFGHPITASQRAQIETLTGQPLADCRDVSAQFDNGQPFAPQVRSLLDGLDLSAETWQTRPILINPPTYAPIAAVLLAELHGRMGYFPTIVRIRPVLDAVPPRFEVAELIDLKHLREQARHTRH